ncbi:hypothetical protein AWENTII_007410 [Aspergillus wentii]
MATLNSTRPQGILVQPDEILLLIQDYLPARTLNAFIQTSKRIHNCLTPYLYNLAYDDSEILTTAARRGQELSLRTLVERAPAGFFDGDFGPDVLQEAVDCNQREAVRMLLKRSVDPNVPRKHGPYRMQMMPLHIAAEEGHLEIVEMLLDAGAKISEVFEKYRRGVWSALHGAIFSGHVDVAALLIQRGIDISLTTARGFTTLHFAARNWMLHIVQLLLERKMDIDIRDNEGGTPLHEAVLTRMPGRPYPKRLRMVKFLLESGASATAVKENGETALHLAASEGAIEELTLLIQYGADVNTKTITGETALHRAASPRYGSIEMVKALLDAGADCLVEDDSHKTPLINAMRGHDHKKIAMLINAGAESHPSQYTPALLLQATIHRRQDLVETLLDHGVDVDAARDERSGMTALMSAARSASMELFEMLLERSKQLGLTNNYGQTVVSFAAMRGSKEVLSLLAERGACMDHRDHIGMRPLMHAARSRSIQAVSFLLERGVDVNVWDEHRQTRTALFYAVKSGKIAIVKLLLDKSGIIQESGDEGQRSLLHAVPWRNLSMMRLLRESGKCRFENSSLRKWMESAVARGAMSEAKRLLQMGVDIDSRDSSNGTLLLTALGRKNKKMAILLIRHGADINTSNNQGKYPLFMAIHSELIDVAHLLIAKGANIEAKTEYGVTPLQKAVCSGYKAAIELLLEKGACVDAPDENGLTPLMHALARGLPGTTEILLSHSANVHALDETGRTPLSWAMRGGDAMAVKKVIEAGANVFKADNNGHTPLWWATHYKLDYMIQYLSYRPTSEAEMTPKFEWGDRVKEEYVCRVRVRDAIC